MFFIEADVLRLAFSLELWLDIRSCLAITLSMLSLILFESLIRVRGYFFLPFITFIVLG